MAGRHVFVYLGHFLVTFLVLNVFYSLLASNLASFFTRLAIFPLCFCVSKVTVGITKKIFLSERIKTDRKAILITGCARGIGKVLAQHLDSKGFHVFASCRDPHSPGAEDLKRSCSSRLQVFALDVTDDDSVIKAVQFVKDHLGSCELWAIINNAGIQKGFLLELTSVQDFKDTLEVNVFGVVRVTKAFLPFLRRCQGRVVNIASVAGRLAVPMVGPYSVSKFASVGFSEYLRYELDFWGIPVISIEPEFFETDMTVESAINQRVETMFADVNEDVRKDYGEEFLNTFESLAGNFFPPSPKMEKIVEAVELAVILKNPDCIYVVCRNMGVRVFWIVYEALPAEIKVFLTRIILCFSGFPKPEQMKKRM